MTAPYTAGTISLVSGSPAVVGTDTAWEVSLIIGGTIYVQFDGGNPLPIATVDSDTEITAALNWTGPTGTYSYAIMRDTAYGQQTVTNAQALATYIQRLNNPALAAAAGVTPSADTLLLFTGTNTATVIDLADVSGDFSGPSGGVVENDLVAFSDATGKAGKKAPPNSIPNSLLAQIPSGTFKGRTSAGNGSPEDLTPAQALAILKGAGAYAKDNILGTVSQASGVPTGAIIERGSNANGTYVRFADGTQTCIMVRAVTGSGAGLRTFNLTYPVAFSAGPSLLGDAMAWGGSFRYAGPTTATIPGTTGAVSVGVEVTQAGAGTVDVVIRAEGRWF